MTSALPALVATEHEHREGPRFFVFTTRLAYGVRTHLALDSNRAVAQPAWTVHALETAWIYLGVEARQAARDFAYMAEARVAQRLNAVFACAVQTVDTDFIPSHLAVKDLVIIKYSVASAAEEAAAPAHLRGQANVAPRTHSLLANFALDGVA